MEQAFRLGGVIVREPFDFWSQNDEPLFVPNEVVRESGAGFPDIVRVLVNGCEDIEQVLNVYILRRDPPRFSEPGLVRTKINRHPGEVKFPGRAEEWKRLWILGSKIISERCEHCDESVGSMRQGKNAEFVEEVCSVGNSGKQPVDFVLIDTLREEGDDSEQRSGVRAKFLEHRGGE